MKYDYKIVIKMSTIALKNLCVIQNWYTLGDIEDFNNMLSKALKDNITSDDIIEIAIDIIEHSSDLSFEDVTFVCDLILQTSDYCMIAGDKI